MKKILALSIKTLLFWLAFWLLMKVVFLLCNYTETFNLSFKNIGEVFAYGLIMDLSATCYLSVFTIALLLIFPFSQNFFSILNKIYVAIALALMLLLVFADLATFPEWGVRLNASALVFLKEPKMIFSNLFWWQWVIVILIYIVLCLCFFFLYEKVLLSDTCHNRTTVKQGIVQSFSALFIGLFLIIPIRGGIDNAPLSPSQVHFKGSYFANQAAYNPFWIFMYSYIHNQQNTSAPVDYMSEKDADNILKNTDENGTFCISLPENTNIIIVILESFSQIAIDKGFCPHLKQIENESLVWDSCYATGNRSDKGTMALLAGFPALIKYHSVARFENCLHKIHSLPQYAIQNGYNTAFVCGFDADFYNLKLFLHEAGCYDITDRTNFPIQKSMMSKWGVADEFMFQKTFEKSKDLYDLFHTDHSPFLLMTYTVSSHTPFDIPKTYKGRHPEKYLNSIAYADSCLGLFIDNLKEQPLWDSTLVVVTSDHTSAMKLFGIENHQSEAYRIPMMFTGGVIKQAGTAHNIISQTDLMTTIAQMLDWKIEHSDFSRPMFRENGFATYYRDELWGYLSKDASYYFDLQNNNLHPDCSTDSISFDNAVNTGKAYTQKIFCVFESLQKQNLNK